ncbi:DNA repair protein RecO [Xylanibacter ruminicola]|uniref:DNA repair protein RecO n=2 Tax=Xylanibacter ruminicola TaxID=839 RepID=D5EVT8_XYLR2|nr:DNA repair protein RecO [Xylanibacter ruminicola]ADE82625.1 putative DNA repair protein RecO [Xylanibacter ruminicola 23]GJG34752.1 DNA repair protein RecO [Xylanibacter ruminicola]
MLTKTQAIVLHAIKYGETRLIVDMFTKVFGRQAFIVSIPKTPRGKVKKQFFQPLTILEIETDIRPRQQLQKLHDVRLAAPFASIPFEPDKLAISLFVAEFLYYALRSEQRNELLYEYLENSIVWLDGQQSSFANFHLVFLLRLTRFLGFYPNLDDYKDGDYFDLRESVFMPMPPVHRDFLHPEEAQKVQLMMRMDFPTMHLFRMSHQERNRLLEVSLKYYRLHLPDFPEMKSIEVLQALYQ